MVQVNISRLKKLLRASIIKVVLIQGKELRGKSIDLRTAPSIRANGFTVNVMAKAFINGLMEQNMKVRGRVEGLKE